MKKTLLVLGASGILAAGMVTYSLSQNAPSEIAGCVYNSSLPTLSNLQTTTLQCDANGQLLLAP